MSKKKTPDIFIENDKVLRAPKDIANALNRGFIKQINDTIKSIDNSNVDPLVHYAEKITTPEEKFQFSEINMSELKETMNELKNLGSSAKDMISMKTIKKAKKSLYPLILNLVNSTITEKKYPTTLQTSKIMPNV